MEKRLKGYITYLESINYSELTEEEKKKLLADLLIQIGFFQHERLVHLIVTVTFAILMLISVSVCISSPDIPLFILTGLFFVMLIPYVRHYYILENGVQKLYKYYDRLSR